MGIIYENKHIYNFNIELKKKIKTIIINDFKENKDENN